MQNSCVEDMSENHIEIPKVEFKNLQEIKNFVSMTKTDTANYYYNVVKDSIKIIGKEQDVYYYNEKRKLWKCVTKEVYEGSIADYFNTISKTLWKLFKKFTEDDDDDQSDLRGKVELMQKYLDSSTYIKTIIDRSTGKLQNNKFATKLNSNPDYLPIRNGKKISLITGELEDRTKDDYFTFECNVDKVDKTPNADKFFKQVMPKEDNREMLRKVLGYMLTGNMDGRCFFIWYGDRSNGKTVIMNLLKAILKSLYHQTSKGIFMKGSQEKVEGASPDKIALMGVRVATYSEGETSDDIDINESFLKMVSGKDEINARALFRAPLTFYPVCKLSLLTNYKPDLNGDKSIIERIIYIFLDSSFVPNPDKNRANEFMRDDDFVEQLKTTYLSEIFSWILKGSIEFYKDKTIRPTKEFRERTYCIFEQQDSITAVFNNKITISKDDKDYINKADIFKIYQEFCDRNSQRCQRRSTLLKRLEDLHVIISTLNGYAVYRGIQINSGESEPEAEFEPSMFIKAGDKGEYIRAEEYIKDKNKLNATIENLLEFKETLQDEFNNATAYIKELERLVDNNLQQSFSKLPNKVCKKEIIE